MAQLGFITLGVFALGEAAGAQGALLQMVNHGLVVAPLFFIIALLHERTGSEDIRDMGGVAFRAPVLATLFLITALATLAMPGSANFMGEFYILLGLFNAKLAIAIIAFTGVALASVYMLRAFIRAMHNRVGAGVDSFDLQRRATGSCSCRSCVAIVAFGVYPQAALEDSATVDGAGGGDRRRRRPAARRSRRRRPRERGPGTEDRLARDLAGDRARRRHLRRADGGPAARPLRAPHDRAAAHAGRARRLRRAR